MTSSDDDDAREKRKQRRLEKLGSNDPICCLCGIDDWRVLEIHHVADCDAESVTVVICANCHKIVTDAQRDHPPHGEVADPFLERVGRFLLGLAELLKVAVETLFAFGKALIERARQAPHEGAAS
jgi:hypothetical protein